MDLSSFQRKAILFIFISILVGAVLLSRKEPLKKQFIEQVKPKIKKQLMPISSVPAKIDINTADIILLSKLPGIGPGLAKQIIDYRNLHGPFKTLGELQKVPGIGPKRVEKIKDKITLKEDFQKEEISLSTKINLNTSSPEQLSTIIGIGPKLARAIVDYRKKNGPFQSIEELTQVPKIGSKTCKHLKEYLYVDIESQPGPITAKKVTTAHRKRSHEIDTSLKCPYCGKALWEKGKKKKVYIRCPHCLRLLNEK